MNIYTLYVKTHKKTGLRYLGYTKQNPHKYTGSGVDWLNHLKTHGHSVDTEILYQSENKSEVTRLGTYYSLKWNILNSQDDYGNKIWANKIVESGSGGGRKKGFKMQPSSIEKIRSRATGRVQSEESKVKRRMPRPNFDPWNKGKLLREIFSDDVRRMKYGSFGENNHSFGKEVPKKVCPHCNKNVDIRNYARSHGDKCRFK